MQAVVVGVGVVDVVEASDAPGPEAQRAGSAEHAEAEGRYNARVQMGRVPFESGPLVPFDYLLLVFGSWMMEKVMGPLKPGR